MKTHYYVKQKVRILPCTPPPSYTKGQKQGEREIAMFGIEFILRNLPTPSQLFIYLSAHQVTLQVLGKRFVGCRSFHKGYQRERKLAHSFALVQCWKTPDKFLVPKQRYHESQCFFSEQNMFFTGADELDESLQSFIIVFSFLSPSPFPFSNLKVPNGRVRF